MINRRVFLAAAAAVAASSASSKLAIADDRKLIVGTDTGLQPFNFVKDGQVVGFDQDIWAEIAKELGRSYSISAMDFGALIPALQTGSVDVGLSSIYMTDARKKVIDFVEYYDAHTGALVRHGDTRIQDEKDLEGKTIAVQTGGAAGAWLKEHIPSAELILFPAVQNMFLALQASRVDAVVHDYPNLAYYANTEGRGLVTMVEKPIGDATPCGIGFPKGSDLVAPAAAVVKAMRSDGRYDALHQKWFGSKPS